MEWQATQERYIRILGMVAASLKKQTWTHVEDERLPV